MKKFKIVLLIACFVVLLIVAFAACNGQNSEPELEPAIEIDAEPEQEEVEAHGQEVELEESDQEEPEYEEPEQEEDNEHEEVDLGEDELITQFNIPDSVLAYQTPVELGEYWNSMIFSLDGDLYQLPAPVLAFVENGWRLVIDSNDIIAAHDTRTSGFRLRRADQVLRVHIHNFEDTDQLLSHAFVTRISYSPGTMTLPWEIPGGVTETSLKNEVLSAFGEPSRVRERSQFSEYSFGDTSTGQITMRIRPDYDDIYSVVLEHRPPSLD